MVSVAMSTCNCSSQWAYTGWICLIVLYFQHQEIATIGKYRLTLNISSVGNYYAGLFLVYASRFNLTGHDSGWGFEFSWLNSLLLQAFSRPDKKIKISGIINGSVRFK